MEGLILKLKLQYFGHLVRRADSLEKTLMLGKIEDRRRRGKTEDEMVGWHHQVDGQKFEQALGVGNGQGNLACCSSWGHKELDTTDWLNWAEDNLKYSFLFIPLFSLLLVILFSKILCYRRQFYFMESKEIVFMTIVLCPPDNFYPLSMKLTDVYEWIVWEFHDLSPLGERSVISFVNQTFPP